MTSKNNDKFERHEVLAVLKIPAALSKTFKILDRVLNKKEAKLTLFREHIFDSIHAFRIRRDAQQTMLLATDGVMVTVAGTTVPLELAAIEPYNSSHLPPSDSNYLNLSLVQPISIQDKLVAVDVGLTATTVEKGFTAQLLMMLEELFSSEGPTVVLNAGRLKKILSSYGNDEAVYIRLNQTDPGGRVVLLWGDHYSTALMPMTGAATDNDEEAIIDPNTLVPAPAQWIKTYLEGDSDDD
jgi:hypothetical protein